MGVRSEANYFRGLVYGVLAALLGAVVWGLVELDGNTIYLPVAVLLGIFIARTVHLGTKARTKLSQALVFPLVIFSVFAGDVIAAALTPMQVVHGDFSFRYFYDLPRIVRIGIGEDTMFSAAFALSGAGIGLFWWRRGKGMFWQSSACENLRIHLNEGPQESENLSAQD